MGWTVKRCRTIRTLYRSIDFIIEYGRFLGYEEFCPLEHYTTGISIQPDNQESL